MLQGSRLASGLEGEREGAGGEGRLRHRLSTQQRKRCALLLRHKQAAAAQQPAAQEGPVLLPVVCMQTALSAVYLARCGRS